MIPLDPPRKACRLSLRWKYVLPLCLKITFISWSPHMLANLLSLVLAWPQWPVVSRQIYPRHGTPKRIMAPDAGEGFSRPTPETSPTWPGQSALTWSSQRTAGSAAFHRNDIIQAYGLDHCQEVGRGWGCVSDPGKVYALWFAVVVRIYAHTFCGRLSSRKKMQLSWFLFLSFFFFI